MTNTLDRARLELLLLARLATPTSRARSARKIRESLHRYVARQLTRAGWREVFDDTLARLASAGAITLAPLAVTESGEARLCGWLGTTRPPDWRTFSTRHLVAHALGMPDSERTWARVGEASGLRGCVIARKRALSTREAPTLTQALDALVWRELGVDTDQPLTLGRLRQHILGQVLGTRTTADVKGLSAQLAARSAGAARTDTAALRASLVGDWLLAGADAAAAPVASHAAIPSDQAALADRVHAEPADTSSSGDGDGDGDDGDDAELAALARAVNEIARTTPHGRFGDRKVLISAIWRAIRERPIGAGMTEAAFKEHLVRANQRDLVRLHRADLAGALPADEVSASEIRHLEATFHFVECATEVPE